MAKSDRMGPDGVLYVQNAHIADIPNRELRYDVLAFLHSTFSRYNFLFQGHRIIVDREARAGDIEGMKFAVTCYVQGASDAAKRTEQQLVRSLGDYSGIGDLIKTVDSVTERTVY